MVKGRVLNPLCWRRLPTATAVSSRESVRRHFRDKQRRKRMSSLLWRKIGQELGMPGVTEHKLSTSVQYTGGKAEKGLPQALGPC